MAPPPGSPPRMPQPESALVFPASSTPHADQLQSRAPSRPPSQRRPSSQPPQKGPCLHQPGQSVGCQDPTALQRGAAATSLSRDAGPGWRWPGDVCGHQCRTPAPCPINAMRVPANGPSQSMRVPTPRWGPSAPGFLESVSSKICLLAHADRSQRLIKMYRMREVTLSAQLWFTAFRA